MCIIYLTDTSSPSKISVLIYFQSWVIFFSISNTWMFISNTIKPQINVFSSYALDIKLFQNKIGKRLLFERFLVL